MAQGRVRPIAQAQQQPLAALGDAQQRKALEVLSQPLSEEELAEARLAVERAKARLRAIGEQV